MAKTMQAAFTKVVRKLRKQGVPSYSEGCLYTDPFGNHCAVGCVLSKKALEFIDERELNGLAVQDLFDHKNLQDELMIDGLNWSESIDFWQDMQDSHDTDANASLDHWRGECDREWKTIAYNYDLTFPKGATWPKVTA